ncbi:uncharacterized protein LOC143040162 [Oratosquilla oratoria]|uniref:uncharacterized protein LOC143040162 n=1 Tax=Oratosquilla oratoria TaxID=337810 RepID=UPI003F76CA21
MEGQAGGDSGVDALTHNRLTQVSEVLEKILAHGGIGLLAAKNAAKSGLRPEDADSQPSQDSSMGMEEAAHFGRYIASHLRNMDTNKQLLVSIIIADVLRQVKAFKGDPSQMTYAFQVEERAWFSY